MGQEQGTQGTHGKVTARRALLDIQANTLNEAATGSNSGSNGGTAAVRPSSRRGRTSSGRGSGTVVGSTLLLAGRSAGGGLGSPLERAGSFSGF